MRDVKPVILLCFLVSFAFFAFATGFSARTGDPMGSGDMHFTHFPDIQSQLVGEGSSYKAFFLSWFVGNSFLVVNELALGFVPLVDFVNLFVVLLLCFVVPVLVWVYSRFSFSSVLFYFFGTGLVFFHFYSSTWAQALFYVWFLLFFIFDNFWFRFLLVVSSFPVHSQGFFFLCAVFVLGYGFLAFKRVFEDERFKHLYGAGVGHAVVFSDFCSEHPFLRSGGSLSCFLAFVLHILSPFYFLVGVLQALRRDYSIFFWVAVMLSLFGLYFDFRAFLMAVILLVRPIGELMDEDRVSRYISYGYCGAFGLLSVLLFLSKMDGILAGVLAG